MEYQKFINLKFANNGELDNILLDIKAPTRQILSKLYVLKMAITTEQVSIQKAYPETIMFTGESVEDIALQLLTKEKIDNNEYEAFRSEQERLRYLEITEWLIGRINEYNEKINEIVFKYNINILKLIVDTKQLTTQLKEQFESDYNSAFWELQDTNQIGNVVDSYLYTNAFRK